MQLGDISLYQNMALQFTHVVERICTPGWRIPESKYMQHNLILAYDGEAVIGCNGKEYNVSRGNLIYFKPGDNRWGYIRSENPMKCYAIDFHFTCPVFEDDGWQMKDVILPFNTLERIDDAYLMARLSDLFSEFIRTWITRKFKTGFRCRAIFLELVSLLLQWKNGSPINYDKIRKAEKLIGYMAEHYNRRVTLKELCDVLQTGPSYIESLFKEVTGRTPIEYLLDIRMNKAKALLQDGCTVSEASRLVGFNDIYYFSKSFKKLEGINPSEYRKVNFPLPKKQGNDDDRKFD